ncbi:MAG: FmdB family zinc ribbon protein [Puniceicoccaceae bacterium]
MPIYEYETVPTRKGEKAKRYEIRQSMDEDPLTVHPETGEKIRKVFTAFAVGTASGDSAPTPSGGHCCTGGACGCHN